MVGTNYNWNSYYVQFHENVLLSFHNIAFLIMITSRTGKLISITKYQEEILKFIQKQNLQTRILSLRTRIKQKIVVE